MTWTEKEYSNDSCVQLASSVAHYHKHFAAVYPLSFCDEVQLFYMKPVHTAQEQNWYVGLEKAWHNA